MSNSKKRLSKKELRKKLSRRRLIVRGLTAIVIVVLAVLLTKGCGKAPDPSSSPAPVITTSLVGSTTTTVTTTTGTTTTTAATTEMPTTTTTTTTAAASSTAGTTAGTTAKTTAKTTTKTTAKTTVYTGDHYVQKDRSQWNLLLVNAWNPIDESYENHITMRNYGGSSRYPFDARALDALTRMMRDAGDCHLRAVSFYRPRSTQKVLFERKVQRLRAAGYHGDDIEDKAATVVARPGTSEHQTGLAADILGSGYSSLTSGFENTAAFRWLKEHCAEYGFILRYPKNKESITGVIYEPWHYRYVGVEHARAIMEQGICLEEYLEQIGG